MILQFIRQYSSWIGLVFVLQLFINILLFLDVGFQDVSFMYLNIVWIVVFLIFCLGRFMRDTRVMKPYNNRTGNYITTIQENHKQQLEQIGLQLQEQKLQLLEKQDELLAWVHEMKSPLTAMQLLIEKVEDVELKERLDQEWLRLYLLLDQQLHASRLMTIEQDNRLEKINIKNVLVNEVKALRSWCFEKNLAIELEKVDVEVISDAKWLGFILRQILSNAVKYSAIGGEVRLFMTIDQGQTILSIQDNGIGIASEDLPRVFRKSYTGTIGRETSAATGMGLYLAKQAADSIGLSLTIQSTINEGTTVQITFPQTNAYVKTLGM